MTPTQATLPPARPPSRHAGRPDHRRADRVDDLDSAALPRRGHLGVDDRRGHVAGDATASSVALGQPEAGRRRHDRRRCCSCWSCRCRSPSARSSPTPARSSTGPRACARSRCRRRPRGWARCPSSGPQAVEAWQTIAASRLADVASAAAPYAATAILWTAGTMRGVGWLLVQFLLTLGIAAIMYAKGERAAEGTAALRPAPRR